MAHYVIYCRKSSESEERQVLSIESQIKELNELAKRLQLPISDTLTESKSAKYPGRPIFGRLMERVAKGEIKGIVSWKLDRLARNPMDGAALVWAIDQGKMEEIVTPYNRLNNNSNDKFLMQLEFGMAKKYVDDLSDNVKRGLRAKLEKGWLPGRAPLGYMNEPKERTIVPDPDRFTLVRKMWDLILHGTSPRNIFRIATEEWGFQGNFGRGYGARLSLSTIYKLFNNPFYYGRIERKEGQFQGRHLPMITEEEYWRAQEILGKKGKARPQKHAFAFTGLIRCGECGCGITAEVKVNKYGSRYVYYHCTKKNHDVECGQGAIREKDLERQLAEYLERIHLPKTLLEIGLAQLQEELKTDQEHRTASLLSLEHALQNCVRRLENLNQMRLRDLINDEEYLCEKRTLQNEKLGFEQRLKAGKNGVERISDSIKETFLFAHEAKEQFLKAAPDGKKLILQGIGSNFLLRDKKLSIDVKKPFVLIEKAMAALDHENKRIELSNNEMNSRATGRPGPEVLVMCSLVKDVRTFYVRNLEDSENYECSMKRRGGKNRGENLFF